MIKWLVATLFLIAMVAIAVGTGLVVTEIQQAHADFFSFSAANDTAQAKAVLVRIEQRQVLILKILCNAGCTSVKAVCAEAEKINGQ